MAKKIFTDESLSTFVDEIKSYTDDAVSKKANLSHTHSIADITGLQNTLDGKASSSHNHSASNITSGTLSSDKLPTIPINKGGTGATTAAGALTNLGITATVTELNYVDGVTSNIQIQLNGKAASSHSHSYLPLSGGTMTGTITTKTGAGISAKGNNGSWSNGRTITNAAIYFPTASVSDGSRYDPLIAGETTEGYVWNIGAGATNQMGFYGYKKSDTNNATLWSATFNPSTGKFTSTANIKAPTFEGSLSGNASSATKLGTDAGSAIQPVYFSGGKPVATTYTLEKSVPSDAKFTDTNTWRPVQNNLTSTSTTDALSAAQGAALKSLVDGKVSSGHTHNYAGSSSAGGSANSAVKLDSSAGASNKPIYFNGGKPVAGSYELNANIKSYAGSLSSEGWKALGGRASGSLISISYNSASANWNSGTYSASLVWGCNDTKGLLDCSYSSPIVTFGGSSASGGSDNAPTWYMKLSGTSAKTYNLDNFAASSHNHAASNITSGTLSSDRLPTVPVTKGGTGATTAAEALTNLGLTATSTELNYCDGVTSNIQTQLNGKSSSGHTHNYAGSSTAGGSATLSEKVKISDTRSVNSMPNDAAFDKNAVSYDFKQVSTIGTPTGFGGTYCAVESIAPWGEKSGGAGYQIAYGYSGTDCTNPRLAIRSAGLSDTSWGSWNKIYTSADKPTPSDIGAADSSHTHSYLPLSGGTVTGAVNFANSIWNLVGDDAYIGDCNIAGCIGVKGNNGATGINFVPYSGSTAQKISINGSGTMTITGTVASTFSGSLSGNATTATTLQTARTIALGTGATGTATSFNGGANITIPVTEVKESYLSWGGKNFAGGYGCLDGAMIQDLSANRLSFAKAAGVTIEYSRDGGSTWTDYGSSNVAKSSFFTSNGYAHTIGKADSTNKATASYQLRVTLNAPSAGIYTVLNKFCIYVSTNGSSGTTCTIQIAKNSAPTTYTTISNNQSISGWSGYNIINVSGFTFGSNSDQYGNLRFIFKCTGGSTQYTGLQVMSIQGFGGVGWATPSSMAKTGHLYSFDGNQNATFPATVTAPTLSGTTFSGSGVATVAEVKNYLGI